MLQRVSLPSCTSLFIFLFTSILPHAPGTARLQMGPIKDPIRVTKKAKEYAIEQATAFDDDTKPALFEAVVLDVVRHTHTHTHTNIQAHNQNMHSHAFKTISNEATQTELGEDAIHALFPSSVLMASRLPLPSPAITIFP